MKTLRFFFLAILCASAPAFAAERLGTVSFANSCSEAVQAPLNRGVALLHDFWYEEAQRQFKEILKADPSCAIAHWGVAMSMFHQIWDRPKAGTMDSAWNELQKADNPPAHTERERDYIAALDTFYRPGKQEYQHRIDAYAAAMDNLHRKYPADVDAGAFYALALLASEKPNDTSLAHQRHALAVLEPLFAQYPDHPGVAHYIVHACDNPAMASQGLNAAQRYGTIAPSAAHSAHMPGHIFARLGMWQPDIEANLLSIAAAGKALPNHPSSVFDELHAYDFLMYAYLQTGQDAKAKAVVSRTAELMAKPRQHSAGMDMSMDDMFSYHQAEFPAVYDLEMRDWKAAAALVPPPDAAPEVREVTYWARIIAEGHQRDAKAARTDLAEHQSLIQQIRKGKYAFIADSTGAQVSNHEVAGWAAFAQGDSSKALTEMRAAADVQDKVGQGEVDIPAREMLADMLLESGDAQQALAEYQAALKMSPNRFNGLYNAGRAAEKAGDKQKAADYYTALMKCTAGAQSNRPELAHARQFLSTSQIATR